MKRPHFLEPVLRSTGPWGLCIERSGRWLAPRCELAGTSTARRRGLAGRDGLPEGHALVIAPTQGIHTFGMRFPIDVVAISHDGRVHAIHRHLPPWRAVLSLRAFAIAELAAGAAADADLAVGDVLLARLAGPEPFETD
jgi:uncharacterized protein